MALGAFIAGLLLAETEYRRAIEATIDPFKGLLLGVFFVSVGMGLDVMRLTDAPGPILGRRGWPYRIEGGACVRLGAAASPGAARRPRDGPVARPERRVRLRDYRTAAWRPASSPSALGQSGLVLTTVTMIVIPALARFGRRLGGPPRRRAAGRKPAFETPTAVR